MASLRCLTLALALFGLACAYPQPQGRAKAIGLTPPMGWMSWEIFRCEIDCVKHNESCINEYLYQVQTDRLVSDGYLAAGYDGIHIDDCWMQEHPERDPQGRLVPDKSRFPSGFKALGDYMHAKGVKFAIYTAESHYTCAGYPASQGHEQVDADTFASWGVDYLKVDGCADSTAYYPTGYALMGHSLENSGRDIQYSCSWPAYLGDNETTKPYPDMIAAGCNLWRNWDDIQCSWGSLASIIDHYGDYSKVLSQWAAPGHFNDPDMLLIGNTCINEAEARTQLAIWSILAAPLIMGNDLRIVPDSHRAILLNREAIAVDQDVAGKAGIRVSPKNDTEVWARQLHDGSVAVALLNKNYHNGTAGACAAWNTTEGGYQEACGGSGGDLACFSGLALNDVLEQCCDNALCAAASYKAADGSGCFKTNTDCGVVKSAGFQGFSKPHFSPPTPAPASIAVRFRDVGLPDKVSVRDIWKQQDLGVFVGAFSAVVGPHDTGFYKMTPSQ